MVVILEGKLGGLTRGTMHMGHMTELLDAMLRREIIDDGLLNNKYRKHGGEG